MMNVVLYEDELPELENVGFVNRIQRMLPNVRLHKASSLEIFETLLKEYRMNVLILDIMGAETVIKSIFGGQRVSSQYIGIEMLRRVRVGHYPRQDSNVPIVMRTARAGEVKIKRLCVEYGTSDVVFPGQDDPWIIEFLLKMCDQ